MLDKSKTKPFNLRQIIRQISILSNDILKGEKDMRKQTLKNWMAMVAVMLGLSLTLLPLGSVHGKDIVDKLGKQVKKLDTSEDVKLLIVAGPLQKVTTEKQFLATVKAVLAPTQHEAFTLPLIMSKLQHMPVAKIQLSGNVIDNVDMGNVIPAGQQGLANTFLIYEGDTTLPAQVIANLDWY
jgi:hypothetical protein